MNVFRWVALLLIIIASISCKQAYRIKDVNGLNITIDSSIEDDSIMNADIIPYRNDIDAKMNKVIGYSDKELLAFKPESALSNFVSDVIQELAIKYLSENNADSLEVLTLMNVKGLRSPLPKGEIVVRNIFELMPFENEIVILTLPGDSIASFFDFLGVTEGDGIAGASVVYSGIKTKRILIGGKPLVKSQNYYFVTSDYLANGGDYYEMIMQPLHRIGTGFKVREAIIENIKMKSKIGLTVNAEIEGRLIFE